MTTNATAGPEESRAGRAPRTYLLELIVKQTDPTAEPELTGPQKAYNVAQYDLFQLAAYGHCTYTNGEMLTDEGKRKQSDYNDRIRAACEQLEATLLRLVAEKAESFRGDWGIPAAWLRSLADDPAAVSLLAVRPDELPDDAPAAVVAPPTDRAAALLDAAAECNKAGGAYAERGANDAAGAAFALMETFLRKAGEAEYAATPCTAPNVCEDGGEPCEAHERILGHIEGYHDLCAPDCGQEWQRRLAVEAHDTGTQQPTPCGPVPSQCDAEAGEPCANHEREQAHAEGEHCFCGPECEDGAQQQPDTEAPWKSDGARIGRALIWSWSDVGKGEFGRGYRAAQEEVRALLNGHRAPAPVVQQPAAEVCDRDVCRNPDAHKYGWNCPAIRQPVTEQQAAAADGEEPWFGMDGCTCKPWTSEGGKRRFMEPGETVDRVSGWHVLATCPHHAPRP